MRNSFHNKNFRSISIQLQIIVSLYELYSVKAGGNSNKRIADKKEKGEYPENLLVFRKGNKKEHKYPQREWQAQPEIFSGIPHQLYYKRKEEQQRDRHINYDHNEGDIRNFIKVVIIELVEPNEVQENKRGGIEM